MVKGNAVSINQSNVVIFYIWHESEDLGVPWTARRSNKSILKKINPEYSLEGLMVKLKLQ